MSHHLEKSHHTADKKPIWFRGLYIFLFFVISYVVILITFFVVIFQFISHLILNKPNEHLQHFGESLSLYACAIMQFITYNTEQMPFPFDSWPTPEEHHNEVKAKRSTKK